MYSFTTDKFHYDKETKEFWQEASTLGMPAGFPMTGVVSLTNPKTKGQRFFQQDSVDYTDSGLDIAGWRFKSKDGIILLIIND